MRFKSACTFKDSRTHALYSSNCIFQGLINSRALSRRGQCLLTHRAGPLLCRSFLSSCLRLAMIFTLSLLSLSALVSLSQSCDRSDFNLLVILPNNTNGVHNNGAKQSWQELLTGEELTRLCVLNQPYLPFKISVTTLWTDCSSVQLSLVQLVRELTAPGNKTTVAVVGWFCKTISTELIGIADNERLGLIQISLNTFLPLSNKVDLDSQYYQMLPSAGAYTEALAQLMSDAGWVRIVIVFLQTPTSYHFEIYEQVTQALEDKGLGPIVTVEILDPHREHDIMNAIRLIQNSGIKIVFVLLPPTETILLLCLAYDYGLQWPDYGWIVPDVSLENVLGLRSVHNCSRNAIQGIISLQVTNANIFNEKSYQTCSQEYNDTSIESNIYTSALQDSIWAIALSINETFPEVQEYLEQYSNQSHTQYSKLITQKRLSQMIGQKLTNISFSGRLGPIYFNTEYKTETKIALCQVIDGTFQKLGIYNPLENITLHIYPPSQIPSDKIARVYVLLPLPVVALLMIAIAICTLIALMNMTLYLYYRNEPEMKASSVGLSILIFFSCYAIYFGCASHTIASGKYIQSSRDGICLSIIWTIFPSGDLILSTLLVKICRIHHIFNRLGKIGKLCSDKSLLLLISMIVLGKLVLLSAWTALDKLQITDYETYHSESKPPFYKVIQKCHSRHHGIWIITCLLYTAIIGGILAFVAFKTRKIRHKDFKDTKKINALIVTLFMSITIVTSLWAILRTTDYLNLSKVLLAILYLLLPVFCQMYLFFPKTMPLLKKKLFKYFCKQQFKSQKRVQFLVQPDQMLPLSLNTKITST